MCVCVYMLHEGVPSLVWGIAPWIFAVAVKLVSVCTTKKLFVVLFNQETFLAYANHTVTSMRVLDRYITYITTFETLKSHNCSCADILNDDRYRWPLAELRHITGHTCNSKHLWFTSLYISSLCLRLQASHVLPAAWWDPTGQDSLVTFSHTQTL